MNVYTVKNLSLWVMVKRVLEVNLKVELLDGVITFLLSVSTLPTDVVLLLFLFVLYWLVPFS